jgi:DNA-binding IclR family transcriptional regulator
MKTGLDDIDIAILVKLRSYPIPSIREIGANIGRSHVTVHQRVNRLKRLGLLQSNPLEHRSLRLTPRGFEVLSANEHNTLRPNTTESPRN